MWSARWSGFSSVLLICLNIESIRQFISRMTNTEEAVSAGALHPLQLPAEAGLWRNCRGRHHGADQYVVPANALSVMAGCLISDPIKTIPVRVKRTGMEQEEKEVGRLPA